MAADYEIARFPDGVRAPSTLTLTGTTPWGTAGLSRLVVNWCGTDGDIALHLDARPAEGIVVLNGCLDGEWGAESILEPYPFSRQAGTPFQLRFDVREDEFRIYLGSHLLCSFPHRMAPARIATLEASAPLWIAGRRGVPRLAESRGGTAASAADLGRVVVAAFAKGAAARAQLSLGGEHPWVLSPSEDGSLTEFTPFAVNWVDGHGNVFLHVNARPEKRVVSLNSYLLGNWGEEVIVHAYPFSLERDVPFLLRFDVRSDRFLIIDDGGLVHEFAHRGPPSLITEVRASTFLWRLGEARSPGRRGRRAVPPRISPPPVNRAKAVPVDWVTAEPEPDAPEPLESFRFLAVVGAWLEQDVIGATVASALAQGCERVYLVDNASPDATIERAVAAGAIVARSVARERYDELDRIEQMQDVVREVSASGGDEHVWWLWLDADEFHHGPDGLTLREYLAKLDRRFRIVGARCFNHFPDRKPAYVADRHPLDFQPLCHPVPYPYCGSGHLKHPLQRWDRDRPPIECGIGFHRAECAEHLLEPSLSVFLHHFPYRDEEATRSRLEHLFARDDDRIGADPLHGHLRLRLRSLDAVYGQHWAEVAFFPPCPAGYVPELRGWERWVGQADRHVARWY